MKTFGEKKRFWITFLGRRSLYLFGMFRESVNNGFHLLRTAAVASLDLIELTSEKWINEKTVAALREMN